MTAKERINQNALKRAAALGVMFTLSDINRAFFEGRRSAQRDMKSAMGIVTSQSVDISESEVAFTINATKTIGGVFMKPPTTLKDDNEMVAEKGYTGDIVVSSIDKLKKEDLP